MPVTPSSTVAPSAREISKHPPVAFERVDWTLFINNSHSSLKKQKLCLFPLKKQSRHQPEQLPEDLIQIFQGAT